MRRRKEFKKTSRTIVVEGGLKRDLEIHLIHFTLSLCTHRQVLYVYGDDTQRVRAKQRGPKKFLHKN